MELAKLQRHLRLHLLEDKPLPPGLLMPGHGFIHRNTILSSLYHVLKEVYPYVEALVGEAYFKQTAYSYIRAHPPQEAPLCFFGEGFAGHLSPQRGMESFAYVEDVARLEWACHEVEMEQDASPLDLKAHPPPLSEHLRFVLLPALRLLSSSWALYDLWCYHLEETQPPCLTTPQDVLVFRHDLKAEVHLLRPGEYVFLQSLQKATLGEAASSAEGYEGFDLTSSLTKVFQQGLCSSFTIDH